MLSTEVIEGSRYFSAEQLMELDLLQMPQHVAIIMDGNRRWALSRSQNIFTGHMMGADILTDILKSGKELGIKVITLFVFSTENWNRKREEVMSLMWLYETYIRNQTPEMVKEGIQFNTIGNIEGLPENVQEAISYAKKATANCDCLKVIFAMNYGARDEMKRAVQKMGTDIKNGKLDNDSISEKTIASYLDTAQYPDPDLLIRTSGEYRISNFLLWQLSYSEVYVTPTFWPDFSPTHLLKAVLEYQQRERRVGR